MDEPLLNKTARFMRDSVNKACKSVKHAQLELPLGNTNHRAYEWLRIFTIVVILTKWLWEEKKKS